MVQLGIIALSFCIVCEASAYPTWIGVVENDEGKTVQCVADIAVPQSELTKSEEALLHRIFERDKEQGRAIVWCSPSEMDDRLIGSIQQHDKFFLKEGATRLQKLWYTHVIVPETGNSPLMPLCAAWLLSPQNIEQCESQMRSLEASYQQNINVNIVNAYTKQVYDARRYALEFIYSSEMKKQHKILEHGTMADIKKSLLADLKAVVSYISKHYSRQNEQFFEFWCNQHIALSCSSLNRYGFDDNANLFEQVKKRIEEKGLEGSLEGVDNPHELDLEYINMCRLKDVVQSQQKQVLLYAAPQTAYYVFQKLISKCGYKKKYISSETVFPTTVDGWDDLAAKIDAKRNKLELESVTVVDEMKKLFPELSAEEWQKE